MKKNNYDFEKILRLIKSPLLTEKSLALTTKGQYTFLVDKSLTKDELKYSLQKIFNVKILRINTLIIPTRYRKVGKYKGKTSTYKKVMIRLQKGDLIENVFN